MRRILIAAVALCGLSAWSEGTTTTTTTTETPTQVCGKLVEAAKTDNFEQFKNLSFHYEGKKAKGKMKFGKMGTEYMSKIKGITCQTEDIAGEHAYVSAQAEGTKRFIPFVNVDGTWKFDAKTYMSMYGKMHGEMGHGKKSM